MGTETLDVETPPTLEPCTFPEKRGEAYACLEARFRVVDLPTTISTNDQIYIPKEALGESRFRVETVVGEGAIMTIALVNEAKQVAQLEERLHQAQAIARLLERESSNPIAALPLYRRADLQVTMLQDGREPSQKPEMVTEDAVALIAHYPEGQSLDEARESEMTLEQRAGCATQICRYLLALHPLRNGTVVGYLDNGLRLNRWRIPDNGDARSQVVQRADIQDIDPLPADCHEALLREYNSFLGLCLTLLTGRQESPSRGVNDSEIDWERVILSLTDNQEAPLAVKFFAELCYAKLQNTSPNSIQEIIQLYEDTLRYLSTLGDPLSSIDTNNTAALGEAIAREFKAIPVVESSNVVLANGIGYKESVLKLAAVLDACQERGDQIELPSDLRERIGETAQSPTSRTDLEFLIDLVTTIRSRTASAIQLNTLLGLLREKGNRTPLGIKERLKDLIPVLMIEDPFNPCLQIMTDLSTLEGAEWMLAARATALFHSGQLEEAERLFLGADGTYHWSVDVLRLVSGEDGITESRNLNQTAWPLRNIYYAIQALLFLEAAKELEKGISGRDRPQEGLHPRRRAMVAFWVSHTGPETLWYHLTVAKALADRISNPTVRASLIDRLAPELHPTTISEMIDKAAYLAANTAPADDLLSKLRIAQTNRREATDEQARLAKALHDASQRQETLAVEHKQNVVQLHQRISQQEQTIQKYRTLISPFKVIQRAWNALKGRIGI